MTNRHDVTGRRTPAVCLALLLFVGAIPLAMAEEGAPAKSGEEGTIALDTAVEPKKDEKKPEAQPFYRGSSFSYRNVVSAISFNKDAEPTYDPFYAMNFGFTPMFWTGEHGYFNLGVDISREITNSDWTTKEGETVLGDVVVGTGLSSILTIPVLEIGISTSLNFITPTSKASQAETLILGINPGLSLSRRFDVLSGISLGYSLGGTKNFHHATTSQIDEPIIPDSFRSTRSADSFMNTGARNASGTLTNTFSLGIDFFPWLGLGGSVTLVNAFLYPFEDDEYCVDYQPGSSSGDYCVNYQPGGENEDTRYIVVYNLELSSKPIPALGIALGANTANPQLSPDSTYQTPFFNRYTQIYLDLRIDFAGLVSQLTSSEEKK